MEVIYLKRREGKTTRLIEMADPHDDYIVVPTKRECGLVFRMAKEMGRNIRMPITWHEATRSHGMAFRPNFLIDNIDMILPMLVPHRIKAITLSDVPRREPEETDISDDNMDNILTSDIFKVEMK